MNRRYLDGSLEGTEGIFELRVRPTRVAYVPKDEGDASIGERGLPEYVLVYEGELPTPEDEPELFAMPHDVDVKKPAREIWLKYPGATVILISEGEDDRFREENPDLIERVEALYLEC